MKEIQELIEELIKLLKEKRAFYIEINSITILQQDTIKKENHELLEELVNKKQNVIDNLTVNDIKFLDAFNKIKSVLKVDDISKISLETYPKFKTVKELIIEIKSLGNKIYETDNFNKLELSKEIEELRGEIEEIISRKKVSTAYINVYKQDEASYYFDRKK